VFGTGLLHDQRCASIGRLEAPNTSALRGRRSSSSGAACLTAGLSWLQNRLRVRGQRRCGRSGQIARAASACPGAGERGTDGESEAEEGARVRKDRAGAGRRRPTRLCEDGAGARCPPGAPEDRLGQSRPHPRSMWDRPLEDARRSDRSATGRADQPLSPLTRQRGSVLERVRPGRALIARGRRACGKAVERMGGSYPRPGDRVAVREGGVRTPR
jgi:hypothetical protein